MKNLSIKPFLRLLKPHKNRVLLIFFAIISANLAGLVFPWIIKAIIDRIIPEKDLGLLNIAAAGLVLSFLLKAAFGFMREYLASVTGESIMCELRNRLYWHLHRLSVNYLENTPAGKVISGLIGDVASIKEFISGGAVDFIYSLFSLVFVAAILFMLDWKLALISLFYLPVFALAFLKISPRLKEKHAIVREKYGQLTSRINEVISGIRLVAGLSTGNKEADIFNSKQEEIYAAAVSSHKLGVFLWMAAEFLSSLGLVVLIWFGSRQVAAGAISVGTLIAFYTYVGLLFYPVIRMAIVNNYYQEASASLERIEAVLSTEPVIREPAHPVIPARIEGNIVFSGVTFGYNDKKNALENIDLEARKAEIIALAGKSGSGKTTFVNLLLRFYDPGKGNIYIDGHNLRDLSLKDYRSRIAMVIQDDYLFGTTVKENIVYGNGDIPEEKIVEAARLANAHQFISELPLGYDTQIGERGIKLSCGQRQRISIARAILRDPAVLILDEATSSIDSETERSIIEDAFKKLMAGRTTFVISHRLSALSHADRIVFLEDGRISESGRHEELLKNKGGYWRMWLSQVQLTTAGAVLQEAEK